MLAKINVENFKSEVINLLGLVTNEYDYVLSDSSIEINDITNYNELATKTGLSGAEKDVRVSFIIRKYDGSEYFMNLIMNQVSMDYDFNKEILFGFYTIRLEDLSEDINLDVESKIFEELFVSSKIISYFNKDSIFNSIPYEELKYNLLKINLDDYVGDINRLMSYAFEYCSAKYLDDSIKLASNLNYEMNLERRVLMGSFKIINSLGEDCKNICFILDLVHMQYDFQEETMYGFFNVGVSDLISTEIQGDDIKYITVDSLMSDGEIYRNFNR